MTAGGEFDARPVRAFLPGPAMAQVLREGLELPAGLTILTDGGGP